MRDMTWKTHAVLSFTTVIFIYYNKTDMQLYRNSVHNNRVLIFQGKLLPTQFLAGLNINAVCIFSFKGTTTR